MTLRAIVLLALAAVAFHEARDVIVLADDRVLDGHHALIALPALLAIALVTFTTRPLIGAAHALVRGTVRAPRARPTIPPILLVVPGPRAARGRWTGRVLAGRAPPVFG